MPLFLFMTVVALGLIILLLVQSWRQTPHGRLDTLPAVLLQFTSQTRREEMLLQMERAWIRRAGAIAGGRRLPVERVDNFFIPGSAGSMPVRLYHPRPGAILPLILYFHGGGWRVGDLESHDKVCRRVARFTQFPVLALDYRRTPEHPFPAAFDDAYTLLCWAADHAGEIDGDPRQLIVMGDSAGGNLAATIALRARNEGGPAIRYQVLIYPVTDLIHLDRPSYRQFGIGFYLTQARMRTFISSYAPDEALRAQPYVSPLLSDDLQHLPPAFVLTAQFDPLHDEGLAYAEKLQAAGVPVVYQNYEGIFHGFFGLPLFGKKAVRAVREVAEAVREAVGD